MKVNDALVGAVLIVLGIAILTHVQVYPTIPGQQYGPALFPGLIACGLIVCGALLARSGIANGGRWIALSAWTRSTRHVGNFGAVIAALILYIVAAETLGFIPVAVIMTAGLMWKFGVRTVVALPAAIIAVLVVHTLFYKLMRVPLPWGVLQPFLW